MDFDPDDHDFDPSDHEPDEYDPEAEFRDPDSDSITIPEVETDSIEIPEVETDEIDVPPDLLRTFWIVVLVVNAAVLALALGAMLIAFRGDLRRGGALLLGGAVLFALAVRRYRSFEDWPSASGADREGTSTASANRDSQAETISGATDEEDAPEESRSHDEDRT